MRTTLADAKLPGSQIARSINVAACDPRFVDYVNSAQQRLAEMGKWWGTYRRLYVCLSSSCVTWPREVANVEGFQVCQRGVDIQNEWYEFGESVASPAAGNCGCGPPMLIERPNACQHTDIISSARIRIYPTVAADAGVKILLQGFDGNGAPIRTVVGGVYVDGEQVTVAAPFNTSTFEFLAPGLTGVQKPATKGRMHVYAVDPTTAVETRIATWEASEVNPSYRRSYVPNLPDCCTSSAECATAGNGCTPPPTPTCASPLGEAIVRLEFVPAVTDYDWLFIQNVQAIAAGCRALVHEERNQKEEAEFEWGRAKRILRNELEKYSPNGLTRVNAQPHGSAHPRRVFAGFR